MKSWLFALLVCLTLISCGDREPEVRPLRPPGEAQPLTTSTPGAGTATEQGSDESGETASDEAVPSEDQSGLPPESENLDESLIGSVEDPTDPQLPVPGVVDGDPAAPRLCAEDVQSGDLCADDMLLYLGDWQSLFLKSYQLMTTPGGCELAGHCLLEQDELMLTWTDAQRFCEDLSWGGFDDWELPSVDELTLIYCQSGAELETGWGFWNWLIGKDETSVEDPICGDYGGRSAMVEGFTADLYWSSEAGEDGQSVRAWRVDFTHGEAYLHLHSHRSQVRCVRREPLSL